MRGGHLSLLVAGVLMACGGSDGSGASEANAQHHARQVDGLRFFFQTVLVADRGPVAGIDGLTRLVTERKDCPGGGEVILDETEGTETLTFSDCVMPDGDVWSGAMQAKEEGGFVYQGMRRVDALGGGVTTLDGGYTWAGDTLVVDITTTYPDLSDPTVKVTGRGTGSLTMSNGTWSGSLTYSTDQPVFEDLGDTGVSCTFSNVSLEVLAAVVGDDGDDPLARLCPLPEAPTTAEPDASNGADVGPDVGVDGGPDPGPFPTEPPSVPACPATFPFLEGDQPLQRSETARIDMGQFFPIDWYEWRVTCHYGDDPDATVFFRATMTWQPYDVALWGINDFDYQFGCDQDEHLIFHGIGPFTSHSHWAEVGVSGASPNNEAQAALRKPWISATLDMLGAHALPCKPARGAGQ